MFIKGLVLHFTHLRSLFSLIDCWLISSWIISLTPLDLQNLSIPNLSRSSSFERFVLSLRGSRSLRPRARILRTVRILRPWGRILRIAGFYYIYCGGGVGVNGYSSLFHFRRHPLPSPLLLSRPRGDFYLLSITNSSIFEGRLFSPPETPGRSWIWSFRALKGLKGILNFGSPDLPMS